MAYTGAWKKRAVARTAAPLVGQRDPEHERPTDNLAPVDWRSSVIAPDLPPGQLGDQMLQLPTIHGLADATPRSGHEGDGYGHGHGDTTRRAQADAHDVHARDLGAVDARKWVPVAARDGKWTAALVDGQRWQGNSPETTSAIADTGAESALDPWARVPRRVVRWRDRKIDMHRWDAQERAALTKQAYTAPPSPGSLGARMSRAPLYAQAGQDGIGTPDQFVAPVLPRSPRPWSESMTTDGAEQPGAATDFGLGAWGL